MTIIAMLGLLYGGQHDRHGDSETPVSVSPEEAEAAFFLAVTLVHWFRSGAIVRDGEARPDPAGSRYV